jgi:hypothetical protein
MAGRRKAATGISAIRPRNGVLEKLHLATLAIASPALLGTLSDESANSGFELLVEVSRVYPDDVWELARVEVKIPHRCVLARPNDRYVEAHCETSLEVDATAHFLWLTCEISDQKT